jgi:hypothetical protein
MSFASFLQIADVLTILGLGTVTYFLLGRIGPYSQRYPYSAFSRSMRTIMAHDLWVPAMVGGSALVALVLVYLQLPMAALVWYVFAFMLVARLRRVYRPLRAS